MRALLALLALALVTATPGPESTAVVANADDPRSVDLAYYYALKRGIPENQICLLSGLPTTPNADLSMVDYQRLVLVPLQNCLASHDGSLIMDKTQYTQDFGSPGSVLSRIEAFVLMMGMPMRVNTQGNTISIQQCLSAWYISYPNKTLFVTTPVSSSFSSMYFALNRPQQTYWEVNYSVYGALINYTYSSYGPWKLVTSLNARTYSYAKYLVDQALLAEQQGKAGLGQAKFVWMLGPQGDPRASMDSEYTLVASQLNASGLSMVNTSFDSNHAFDFPIAGFICGTDSMGTTIENNTYAPHCIMDDLTSYGASPTNFNPSGQAQVSITRWNVKGCLGSHGAVQEPYADAFPSRQFIVDYARGTTMSEAYYRNFPFVLWMNYVAGDAMAAPFAIRPLLVVTLDSVQIANGVPFLSNLTAFQNASTNLTSTNYRSFASNTLSCTCCLVQVSATPQQNKSIASIQVFVDGVLWVTNSSFGNFSKTFSTSFSLPTSNKTVSVLVVVQHNSTFREKVWLQRWISVPIARTCEINSASSMASMSWIFAIVLACLL